MYLHRHAVSSGTGIDMKVRDVIPPLPKSAWTTSLGDLTRTPQEQALRDKATHDWLATRHFLAQARRRQAIARLKQQAQQAPTKLAQQEIAASAKATKQKTKAPATSP